MPHPRDRSILARLSLLLVVLALVAAACSGGDDGEEAGDTGGSGGSGSEATGGTLVDLQNFSIGEPDHIDPGLAGVLQGAQIGQLLFDTLTEYDYEDRDNPVLTDQVAAEWETPDEGKTWIFTLKEGQEFSDGTPVLPSNFRDAWNLHASAEYASEISYHFSPIEGAAEVTEGTEDEMSGVVADDDELTLTVTLTDPLAEFPAIVTHPVFSPKTAEGITAGADYEQEVMIGNGPFAMAEPWQHEESITVERNDRWNGGIYGEGEKAKLARIEFRISKDVDSAYADFESGTGHTATIPSGRFDEATDEYEGAVERSMGLYHFFVNQEDETLGGPENLKLRQAISLAIDREAINDTAFDGSRPIATGITAPNVPGYEEGLCGDFCEHDPERAKDLYDEWVEAGGEIDGPVPIQYNSGSTHEDVVGVLQANLKETLDLDVELVPVEPPTYFGKIRGGDCNICRAGWIWDYPSYDSAAYALLHSSAIGGDNIARYDNPEVDELLEEARSTLEEEDRYELYREAEKRALDDMILIPIVWYAGNIVHTDEVSNFIYTPLQFVLYEQVTLDG